MRVAIHLNSRGPGGHRKRQGSLFPSSSIFWTPKARKAIFFCGVQVLTLESTASILDLGGFEKSAPWTEWETLSV
jgi:hypothetical protein